MTPLLLNITHNGATTYNIDEETSRTRFPKEVVDAAVADANAGIARRRCAAHIERHYPTYKQLNLLRNGTNDEKDKMGAFINACRDWSNGENPDPAALEAIQP